MGETAFNRYGSVSMTWEQVSERISELLNEGRFATQDILQAAEPYDRKQLADKLWYLHQDVEVEYFIPDYFFTGGFDVSTDKIAEALQGEKPVQEMIDGMKDLIKQYEADRDVLRFHFHNLPEILEKLEDRQLDRVKFSAEPSFTVKHKYFITDDEKNKLVASGSNVAGGRKRIAKFFKEPHTAKEKADFLKNEYGIGGSGRSGYNTWHDSKGLVLKKGNLSNPDAEVTMKWNEVAERVSKLVAQDRFITQKDIDDEIRYAKRVIANASDKGVIFRNPQNNQWETADEYLSGNIREKLEFAKKSAEVFDEDLSVNISALEKAMPKPLEASEIDVRLGATWLDTDIIKQFMIETLQVPRYLQNMFDVNFSKYTSEWNIEGKNVDRSNVAANMTYGSARKNAYSNSMTELYTMMRYLQADKLKEMGMHNFDAWAANFGEAVTAIELAPEGTGYRAKTRFSKFFNLPELINVFKECADIKTADMLNLPVPEAHFHNVVIKPSDIQKDMVAALSDRAKDIHDKKVQPEEDNMLKVTNDGRKIGLDQRLIDPLLPDEPNSKVNTCIANVFDIYQKNDDKKSTQLVFCDFSTPKNDGSFNLYDDIRDKLISKGVPKEEIAFIHEADSEAKKKELFSKVRQGKVRVLLGSTAKCGAGTNIQDKLIALHHLDCPWRPSDLEQREGRIIRQGNENKEVEVYRYMTEATFDAYLYQTIENKQRFISQIMSSKSPVRSCEDVDEATLSYAEVKALCAGNTLIKEKMDLDVAVTKLKVSKANHTSQQYSIEDSVRKHFPERIAKTEQRIEGYKSDLAHVKAQPIITEGISPMTVLNKTFTDKEEAGKAILLACKQVKSKESLEIGSYKGFDMSLSYDSFAQEFHLELQREMSYTVTLGTSESGNILRIDNTLDSIEKRLENSQEQLETLNEQLSTAKAELGKPFPQEAELTEKLARLAELNTLLNIDDNAIENASMAAEKKPDILISADEIKPMRNVSPDCFISGNKEDVAALIKDETDRIADIERTVRKFSKLSAELVM